MACLGPVYRHLTYRAIAHRDVLGARPGDASDTARRRFQPRSGSPVRARPLRPLQGQRGRRASPAPRRSIRRQRLGCVGTPFARAGPSSSQQCYAKYMDGGSTAPASYQALDQRPYVAGPPASHLAWRTSCQTPAPRCPWGTHGDPDAGHETSSAPLPPDTRRRPSEESLDEDRRYTPVGGRGATGDGAQRSHDP